MQIKFQSFSIATEGPPKCERKSLSLKDLPKRSCAMLRILASKTCLLDILENYLALMAIFGGFYKFWQVLQIFAG